MCVQKSLQSEQQKRQNLARSLHRTRARSKHKHDSVRTLSAIHATHKRREWDARASGIDLQLHVLQLVLPRACSSLCRAS